jgi:hypothetical protein
MQWINQQDPLNNALVVFLHGIFGRFYGTWGMFPQRLQSRSDPTVKSYDFYLFDYSTSLLRQPSLTAEPLAQLRAFLSKVSPKYDTVVLVGHSQGGLLAKLYIIQALLEGKGRELPVDLVITCHTPHRGITLCNIPLALRTLPVVGRLIQCHQLCELGSWSSVLRHLKEHWGPPLIDDTPCEPTASHRYIRSITLAAKDWLVWKGNARGFPVDTLDNTIDPGRCHSLSIEQLEDVLREYLEKHGNPSSLLRQIRRLQEHPAEKANFAARTRPTVLSIVHSMFPSMPPSQLSSAADLALDAFLTEFPHHPLRKLPTLDEALYKYVSRKLAAIRGLGAAVGVP